MRRKVVKAFVSGFTAVSGAGYDKDLKGDDPYLLFDSFTEKPSRRRRNCSRKNNPLPNVDTKVMGYEDV